MQEWNFDETVYANNNQMIDDYFELGFGQLLLAEQCKQTSPAMNTALQEKEAYCKALEELYQKVYI